ncbi:DUF2849 domain-containing protein [Salipiger bermudensis]|uniref:DUF2849 domain-containing protein n=1 Tax=Salipiger bermudensis TaxID=344736 RepID=UPI000C8F8D44|nr:DUF2849 domain-containing protein [Salipiger bermudensis]MAE91645.1 sulfite reductase [Pelagibaca sp.]MBN9675889.1 DUF2849 domain-containing protein [Salipiger bermudensis]MBR9892727.1 DUF2849 domain-containing protein [bacterium]
MPKAFTPKVVTANALLEGDVIYLASDDRWVRRLDEAEIITDEAIAQLRLLDAQARASEAVGVYLADMAPTEDGPQPTHFREEFRATGPSNYHHGKQAAG